MLWPMNPVRIGLLGCGAIAPAYLRNLKTHFSRCVEVVACADVVPEAATNRADEFGLRHASSPEELLSDPEIELVVNLTPAPRHYETSLSVLHAGKHLFSEKPLALSRQQGNEILRTAADRSLQVGGAVDTFLGPGLQSCRALLEDGRIGTPIAATAIITLPMFGVRRYHDVYRGALFDIGPYYITALVCLLGPVTRVSGAAEIRFKEKLGAPGTPDEGATFRVDIPTTVAATFEMVDGTVVSFIASGDAHSYFPRTEIFGTHGSLRLNDANQYGGSIELNTVGESSAVHVIDTGHPYGAFDRGLGVAEMAVAMRAGRKPLAHGGLMSHVLDVMLAIEESSRSGKHVRILSSVSRPDSFDPVEFAG